MQLTIRQMLLCGSGIVCILAGQVVLPAYEPVSALQALAEGSQPEPTRAELDAALNDAVAKLKGWKDSFTALKYAYKWSNPIQLTNRFPEMAQSPDQLATWYHVEEHLWSESGLVSIRREKYENGIRIDAEFEARNSRIQWKLSFVGANDVPAELSVLSASRQFFSHSFLLDRLYRADRWLPEIISETPIQAVGFREIHGAKCIGFQFAEHPTETIWLDTEHDSLVRLLEAAAIRNTRWECTEFRQAPGGRWFPEKGQYSYGDAATDGIYNFELLDVEFNPDVVEADFEPPKLSDSVRIVGNPALLTLDPDTQISSQLSEGSSLAQEKLTRNLPLGLLVIAFIGIIAVALWRQASAGDTAKK